MLVLAAAQDQHPGLACCVGRAEHDVTRLLGHGERSTRTAARLRCGERLDQSAAHDEPEPVEAPVVVDTSQADGDSASTRRSRRRRPR